MSKIDLSKVTVRKGSRYPAPYDQPCQQRETVLLSDAAGLTQFGAVITRLAPGAWSSQRHWHAREDEFVYVLEGEVVLVADEGETLLRPGDCAGFKAGVRNGHHLQNRSALPASFLAIGTRDDDDHGEYPDIDMKFVAGRYAGKGAFVRKDGSAFDTKPGG